MQIIAQKNEYLAEETVNYVLSFTEIFPASDGKKGIASTLLDCWSPFSKSADVCSAGGEAMLYSIRPLK